MNKGISESLPHVQDTCSAGKVMAISYRSNHPLLRLASYHLVEYTIIAYRNQDAEWFYLKYIPVCWAKRIKYILDYNAVLVAFSINCIYKEYV